MDELRGPADQEILEQSFPSEPVAIGLNDYFVEKDGVRFAGTHLLVDMGAQATSPTSGSLRKPCVMPPPPPMPRFFTFT